MHALLLFLDKIDWTLSLYACSAFLAIGILLTCAILWIKSKFATSAVCKIYINEDPELTKTVPAGDTLLSALTHEGVAVPSPCGGKATCKQCRIQIVKDADDPLETDVSTFSKKQLKEGWRLSCQSKVKHDIAIKVGEELIGVKEWTATVLSNKNVATFIKELSLEIPEGTEINYQPGDYIQVHVPVFKTNTNNWKETTDTKFWEDWDKYGLWENNVDFTSLPGEVIRAYSMASHPAEGRRLLFNIRIATPPIIKGKLQNDVPWGICSTYTFSLKAGDKVKISGPYGESHMIHDNRAVYFLIGGAGSSFARAHILHLFYTLHTKRKVALWYGARSLRENIYPEEYEKLEKEFPNFSYHLTLSEPLPEDISGGWDTSDPVKTNFLFRAFEIAELKKMDAPEDSLYFVCGPPLHNKAILKLLDDYGVPRENIVLDDFGS